MPSIVSGKRVTPGGLQHVQRRSSVTVVGIDNANDLKLQYPRDGTTIELCQSDNSLPGIRTS